MATDVILPQWGMNMEEGLLVKWLVKEGDTVKAGQPLVEVETAKINSELEAPASGVIAHISIPEGTTVKVGTIVAVIAAPGEVVSRPAVGAPTPVPSPAAPTAPAAPVPAAQRAATPQVTPVARRLAKDNAIDLGQVQGTGPNGRITEEDVRRAIEARKAVGAGLKPAPTRHPLQVIPAARLLAKQRGIDLGQVQGTGPNGRVLVADVERAVQEQAQRERVPQAVGTFKQVTPLKGLRKTIADRMMQSIQSMAQVTLTTEADVSEMVRLREGLLSRWRPHRIRPLDLELIVKATAASLKEHPRLNAFLVNNEIRISADVNVGVAMAVPDGLMVPVVKRADEKDLLTIAQEIRQLADKSRKGGLGIDEVTGASFTITSLSNYEIDAFTPIIDPPQVAILGVGRIVEKPAVFEGQIAIRSMMFLSLAFDHRALDGVPAGDFLRTLKRKLENPAWMA
jgi:pyruvate dehydrogenase E2 component (dihydrolipoamide acetyltransferase)